MLQELIKTTTKNANGSSHVNEKRHKKKLKIGENDNQMLAAQMFKQNWLDTNYVRSKLKEKKQIRTKEIVGVTKNQYY